jgi:hypothetical protein
VISVYFSFIKHASGLLCCWHKDIDIIGRNCYYLWLIQERKVLDLWHLAFWKVDNYRCHVNRPPYGRTQRRDPVMADTEVHRQELKNSSVCSHNRFYSTTSVTTYLLTYLLTPWSRILLEKLTVNLAASQEIPRIYGTRNFLTVSTRARHLSLSWASSIQSPRLPPNSWRSILILTCICLWSRLFHVALKSNVPYHMWRHT